MPIIKSAKKRVRTAKKATLRNLSTKRSLKKAVKSLHASIKSGAGSTKKAARKKSQLAKASKKSGSAPKKTIAKKPAKKATPKKKK